MAYIDAVLEASNNIVPHALDPVPPDSPIGRANTAGRRDPYEQARLLLTSAEDHLRTVLMIVQGNVLPIFSLFSLLRPAAEADARIAYVLDPAIDETRRLARGLTIRLENLVQVDKVKPDAAWLAGRVEQITAKATANGIAAVPNKRGQVIAFGEVLPKEIDLFAGYLKEGAFAYRFLSAHVHSMPWVMLNADKATPTAEPGISMMPLELDTSTFVAFVALIVGLHDRTVARLLELAGYPALVWTKTMDTSRENARARYMKLLTSSGATTNPAT